MNKSAKQHDRNWQPGRTVEAVRHPISLRLFCEAPYVPELFEDNLESRVTRLSQASGSAVSPTLQLQRGDRIWHIAGSADDVLLHTSCMMACLEDIFQYLGADLSQYDFGPPLVSEVFEGKWIRHPLMWFYWAQMEKVFTAHLADGYTHVVYVDIARCSESMAPDRILSLLHELNADEKAVSILGNMHHFWQRTGCPGVPLVPAFAILLKLYLKQVDDRLKEAEVTFVRLQDDFRLLCFGQDEADAALNLLKAALREIGLSIHRRKTGIVAVDEVLRHRYWKTLGLKRTLQHGITRPALNHALTFPWFRPAALKLLARLYGHNCRAMT